MYVVKVLEVSDDGRHEGCGGEVWLDDGVYCSLCGKVMPLEPLPSSPPVPFQGLDGPPGTDALEPLKGSDGPPVVESESGGGKLRNCHLCKTIYLAGTTHRCLGPLDLDE